MFLFLSMKKPIQPRAMFSEQEILKHTSGQNRETASKLAIETLKEKCIDEVTHLGIKLGNISSWKINSY